MYAIANAEAEVRFKRLAEAHSVLRDPDRRRAFDCEGSRACRSYVSYEEVSSDWVGNGESERKRGGGEIERAREREREGERGKEREREKMKDRKRRHECKQRMEKEKSFWCESSRSLQISKQFENDREQVVVSFRSWMMFKS